MNPEDSVTQWLAGLQTDERSATEKLWQRYWRRVAGMARRMLGGRTMGGVNEDDIAQSAFKSFFIRARDGRFPQLEDRRDLWNLLVTITIRKSMKQKRRHERQSMHSFDMDVIADELTRPPSPEVAAILRDEIQRLVSLLDPTAQRVTALLLEGHTNEEVAERCGVSLATIERKRRLIRETWRREMEQ